MATGIRFGVIEALDRGDHRSHARHRGSQGFRIADVAFNYLDTIRKMSGPGAIARQDTHVNTALRQKLYDASSQPSGYPATSTITVRRL
jgi:hypothetical protein